MPRRDSDSLQASEARKIAMERLGLSAEPRDYNLYRILSLACQYLGAKATSFSVPVRGGSAILEFAGGTIAEPACASKGCALTYKNQAITFLKQDETKNWDETCPSLAGLELVDYIGVPIYSPNKKVLGVFSLFFNQALAPPDHYLRKGLNDFGRLIEDSLLMHSLNIRDSLTKMFNRRYLEAQLINEWQRASRLQQPLSVAMIDIDKFKSFNDTAGHQAGDQVIVSLAKVILTACKRASDSACRYGGEEFVLILPMTDVAEAKLLIAEIRDVFAALAFIHPGQNNQTVSFSCGISTKVHTDDMANIGVSKFFHEADIALYNAKASGRNAIVHHDEMEFTTQSEPAHDTSSGRHSQQDSA